MTASAAFAAHLEDLFAPLGIVKIRRMFGGAGVFCDGLMFGLVSDDVLYLKADDGNRADFEREGCAPFRYYRDRKARNLPYFTAPDRLFDEPEEMLAWGRAALEAAARAKAFPGKVGTGFPSGIARDKYATG